MRSSPARRSLTTDFDPAKRRAAAVIEPVSAIAANASTDSSLIILRFIRKVIRQIIAGGHWVRKSIVPFTINLGFRRGGTMRSHGRFHMFRFMSAAAAAAVILAAPAFARVLSYPESFHTQMMQTNGT